MKSYLEFLTEALIDIQDSDIEMLFSPLREMSKDIDHALNSSPDKQTTQKLVDAEYSKYRLKDKVIKIFSSSQLQSPISKLAHEINPIKINVCRFAVNAYIPIKAELNIGFNTGAFDALRNYSDLPNIQQSSLRSEFTELRVKATIRHELTHWVDDSLNNLHMKKNSLSSPQEFTAYLKAGKSDVNLAPIEINAIVNQVDQIKRMVGQEKYDRLTWQEFVDLHPALKNLNTTLGAAWRKNVFKRLSRENLIGKNMKI